jgi:hypothetical protein
LFAGKDLDDSKILVECGIKKESVVHLVLKASEKNLSSYSQAQKVCFYFIIVFFPFLFFFYFGTGKNSAEIAVFRVSSFSRFLQIVFYLFKLILVFRRSCKWHKQKLNILFCLLT